ncbi:hypothetical protein DICVIV_03676 [Dictyocaulus viviparus]|uniref:Uncharacterized protein n=1 Tax=Dictyocaulus viviparus TaxID=29172 RepID=A0A0D8XZS7_DICVI|nr:hypothetical protein DICVIV_03676 [Dictyocaulus viviparus]
MKEQKSQRSETLRQMRVIDVLNEMDRIIEISSTQGLTARFLPLGATLTSLLVKDKYGKPVDVVLGFDNYKDLLFLRKLIYASLPFYQKDLLVLNKRGND